MIDFIIIIGLLLIAGLTIAYFGMDVEVDKIDDLDKVLENKKRK